MTIARPDSTTTNINRYSSPYIGERVINKYDNLGRTCIYLIADITENINNIEGSGNLFSCKGFSGIIFDLRRLGYIYRVIHFDCCCGSLAKYLKLNTSSPDLIKPCVLKKDDKYYLGISIIQSGREIFLYGTFNNCLDEFILLKGDPNGSTSNFYPEIEGYEYVFQEYYNDYYMANVHKAFKSQTMIDCMHPSSEAYNLYCGSIEYSKIDECIYPGFYLIVGNDTTDTSNPHLLLVRTLGNGTMYRLNYLNGQTGQWFYRYYNNNEAGWSNWIARTIDSNAVIKDGSINKSKLSSDITKHILQNYGLTINTDLNVYLIDNINDSNHLITVDELRTILNCVFIVTKYNIKVRINVTPTLNLVGSVIGGNSNMLIVECCDFDNKYLYKVYIENETIKCTKKIIPL